MSADLHLEIAAHLMAKRLRTAADNMQDALNGATDDDVQEALAAVFFNYLDAPDGSASAELATAAHKVRTTTVAASIGVPFAASTLGATTARAYGGDR